MTNKPFRKQLLLFILSGIISTFIIASVVIVISFFLETKTKIPDFLENLFWSSNHIKWENYQSYQYNFSFKHPQDWIRKPIEKNVFSPWQLKLYLPNKKDPLVSISVEKLKTSHSLQEYWDNMIYPRLNTGFKEYIIEEKNLTSINLKIDNKKQPLPSYYVHYRYEKNGEFINVRRLITVHNQRAYNLLFNGDIANYNQYESVAKEMIKSFELSSD